MENQGLFIKFNQFLANHPQIDLEKLRGQLINASSPSDKPEDEAYDYFINRLEESENPLFGQDEDDDMGDEIAEIIEYLKEAYSISFIA